MMVHLRVLFWVGFVLYSFIFEFMNTYALIDELSDPRAAIMDKQQLVTIQSLDELVLPEIVE